MLLRLRPGVAQRVLRSCAGALWLSILALSLSWHRTAVRAAEQPPPKKIRLETFDAAWQIINDSYYDPSFHGLNWATVKAELAPKAAASKSTAELRQVIQEMLERLGDSHMALIPGDVASSLDATSRAENRRSNLGRAPATSNAESQSSQTSLEEKESSSGDGQPGLEIRIIEGMALVTRIDPGGPAAKGGVRPGWIVESVSGRNIAGLLESLPWAVDDRRAQFLAWRAVTSRLSGASGSTVTVDFLDAERRVIRRSLERVREPGEPTKLGYLPPLYAQLEGKRLPHGSHGIGLIRFNMWLISISRPLDEKMDEYRNADGIILDLRGNLGGIAGMILGISGHFLNERVSLGTLKMRGNDLQFLANPRRVSLTGERVEPFAGPLAILIDPLSLSAAEIFAAGMQAVGRARLFGEPSGGQALPAIWDKLPNGDVLYHAFGDFVTASGARLEGLGATPDQVVPTTRAGLLAGHDAALEAAVKWIESENRRLNSSKLHSENQETRKQ